MSQVSPKQFAVDLARKAGKIMLANFKLGMQKQWKADNSPVTVTDLAINKIVLDAVRKKFPHHGILAEEGSDLKHESDYVWVCDPVDGTTPFAHGMPIFTFSIALIQNGDPVLGVVYEPFMDRLFVGEKGGGAYLNGKQLHCNKNSVFEKTVINIEFCHGQWIADSDMSLFHIMHRLYEKKSSLVALKSVVYAGTMVALGELSAVLFMGNSAHDGAALKVIVEEAGGKVTDLYGNEQRYDRDIQGVVISNGILHEELLEIIRKSTK